MPVGIGCRYGMFACDLPHRVSFSTDIAEAGWRWSCSTSPRLIAGNSHLKCIVRLAAGGIAALLGIIWTSGAAAQTSNSVSLERAPPSWIAYAQTVSEAIRGAISGEEPAALRFKAYLDASRTDPALPAPILALRLWIDAKGAITRAEFAPFAHEAANSDLSGLLVGRAIGSPPPKGMLLPLRLSVQLQPAPARPPLSG